MILYHSSYTSVRIPDITFSRDFLDFGKGFYLTSIYDQAEKYAQRFKRRRKAAWVSMFELKYNPIANEPARDTDANTNVG
ncbi:MAG: DUF3990 domain-containing protein [Muribaculaceae bacterium]|nr:DUF3990 domain-containing protein [Muribaculaceae bacterium]